jgi:protein-S-isoprenylcysteine O-methyltransferase Ste14
MQVFTWVVDIVVILGMAYVTFAMALAGWFAALRKGEAVTLLPKQRSKRRNLAVQITVAVVSLAICTALTYLLWIPIPPNVSPRGELLLRIFGLVLFLSGAIVVVSARRMLGRMWGISTSREVKLLPDHRLVKSGPYKLIRHPMYSGWWLALVGAILIYRTWILVLLLAFSLLVFVRRARLEEKVLAERFGAEWQAYAESTRSLIPFIY